MKKRYLLLWVNTHNYSLLWYEWFHVWLAADNTLQACGWCCHMVCKGHRVDCTIQYISHLLYVVIKTQFLNYSSTFQVLNSHMWLPLYCADVEHFYYCRKFHWIVLVKNHTHTHTHSSTENIRLNQPWSLAYLWTFRHVKE